MFRYIIKSSLLSGFLPAMNQVTFSDIYLNYTD